MISFLEEWLGTVGTDLGLRKCLVRYAKGHGFKNMEEVCGEDQLWTMAQEQDQVGWRRFMKGMIVK